MAHKVFVSFHHEKDQSYANEFRDFYGANDAIIDKSLPEEINSEDNDYILGEIRTKHLKDSTVTAVLVGQETWSRKWVDWEIYSSLRSYRNRTINGLLGIILPNAGQWPDRLADNYREEQRFGKTVQTGYAKVIRWSDIAPPFGWRLGTPLLQGLISERRRVLTAWIESAFQNRSRPELIVNNRPRMQRNRPIQQSFWS